MFYDTLREIYVHDRESFDLKILEQGHGIIFFHNNFPLIGNKNDREKLKLTGKWPGNDREFCNDVLLDTLLVFT